MRVGSFVFRYEVSLAIESHAHYSNKLKLKRPNLSVDFAVRYAQSPPKLRTATPRRSINSDRRPVCSFAARRRFVRGREEDFSKSGTRKRLRFVFICVVTPAQEECLQRLQNRMEVAYDTSIPQHQEALKGLWKLSFPEEELHAIVSEQWKEMGWQGKDPSTDFRGGGFISLENLLYFAKRFPKSFQDLLRKQVGDRSVWEYPFAVAGINITFMLIQMLGLETVKPPSIVGETFLRFLSVNESAFDILYCIAFKLMDHQWLSMRASYMEFNTVMKSTRRQLEREIMVEDITYIEDMPSYSLLLSQ
ncbi:PREDICTED: ELMO domain-containing protein C [Brassica oleracea var. oleracea]|uniref:ELMO domain-containing protein C n=1 Tax=Brassica oleracea var. oleracea TaxID=109376 RepID=UPI0006A6ED17|nr:PREDICTED: ELMO domain-containing protein C [Brassica oleracea var. oleracea]